MLHVRDGARAVALRFPDGSLQLQPVEVLEEVLRQAAMEGLFIPKAPAICQKIVNGH